jgi:hypothetical protein
MIIRKLETVPDYSHAEKRIIKNILTVNHVKVSDSLCTSNELRQTNGVLQGDPLSPLFF